MTRLLKIVVAGAGLIGKRHIEYIRKSPGIELAGIVDPSDAIRQYAEAMDVKWHAALADMFAASAPDGVIVATPNQLHVENALECIAAGCPVLIEKPIASSASEVEQLVKAARSRRVPILVGHHRRHNPVIQKARMLIEEGRLGRIITVDSTCWLSKPDDYFIPEWRKKRGAGPFLVNAIHDIDLLRFLCGEVESVYAIFSNDVRRFENEETGVALLKFKSGVLGTMNVSDAVAAPWSWEISSGENEEFPTANQFSLRIGGSRASLSIPDLTLWSHGAAGHWKTPIHATSFPQGRLDPLAEQLAHFGAVIRREAQPLVSAEEATQSLKVIEAVQESAESGKTVSLIESRRDKRA